MVQTVLGPVPAEQLGITYAHEHLLTHPPADAAADPDFTMDDEAVALGELGRFRAAGGGTIIEMTPRHYGRDPVGLQRISAASGVHIVCVSGAIKDAWCRSWAAGRGVDAIADELIGEVLDGIDGSGVRAGLLKAGSSLNRITPLEETVFRAVAQAHRATGAAISTHTEAGTMGLEQVALLTSEGVDPARIVIGHVDRNLDLDYHRALLATGVTISYDQISKEKYFPDARRVECLLQLVAEGYRTQIVLSCDFARRSNWPGYGNWGGPGLTYILWRFAPWLRAWGLPPDVLDDFLIHNPVRIYARSDA